MKQAQENDDGLFKIGSVSRLTGLSTHTLRKWEDRYGAITPTRTPSGTRYYTRGDLERLLLIKRLVDSGAAPRDVARLEQADLERRTEQLEELENVPGATSTRPVRVAVIGSSVTVLIDQKRSPEGVLRVVARANTSAALDKRFGRDQIDVLIYECPVVANDTHEQVAALRQQLHAAAAVVVYNFAARADLLTLQSPLLATVRAPVDAGTLEQVVLQLARPGNTARSRAQIQEGPAKSETSFPAPRLSLETIAEIARAAPNLQCECPQHLAEIILGLRAFEQYSEACERRSPEDATLHNYLWRSAAQARALFEDAIEHVAEAEGIHLNK